jgi:hypothetical protein
MAGSLMLRTLVLYPPRRHCRFLTLGTGLLSGFAELRVFVYAGEVLLGAATEAGALAEDMVGLVSCTHLCGLVVSGTGRRVNEEGGRKRTV